MRGISAPPRRCSTGSTEPTIIDKKPTTAPPVSPIHTRASGRDVRRLIVLRTGSNYQMPYPGRSAADHIASLRRDGFPALIPALAAAYRVGSVVVEEIVAQWEKYADTIPTSA
jgi:purine nucleoside permease